MITMSPRLTAGALIAMISCASNAAPSQTQTSTTTFDAAGRVSQVEDGMLHLTKFGYDALSRRSTVTDHKNGITKYRYDSLDQLTEVTDARFVVTTYTIDGLGNLKQTLSSDTGATDNTHDEAGNLTSSIDAKRQRTSYKYDVLNRIDHVSRQCDGHLSVRSGPKRDWQTHPNCRRQRHH
jgi:YD repeat-containing protein